MRKQATNDRSNTNYEEIDGNQSYENQLIKIENLKNFEQKRKGQRNAKCIRYT